MSDISKCCGIIDSKEDSNDVHVCPLRDICKRFTDKINHDYQSWIAPPYKDGQCEAYWEDRDDKQKLSAI